MIKDSQFHKVHFTAFAWRRHGCFLLLDDSREREKKEFFVILKMFRQRERGEEGSSDNNDKVFLP